MDFAKLTQSLKSSGAQARLAPVDDWDPPFCGDMNLIIKKSGQWIHEGTPFTRPALVKLFASVIKKENSDYFLVTPVEKIGITVEDVPFVIIDWTVKETDIDASIDTNLEAYIEVTTQTGNCFVLDQAHPVELRNFDGVDLPYCKVRRNLWARVNQNVFYQWVEYAAEHAKQTEHVQGNRLIMQSGDYSFSLGEF